MSKEKRVVRTVRVPVRIELVYDVFTETEQEALEEVEPPAVFRAAGNGGGIHPSSLDPRILRYRLETGGPDSYLWEESLIEETEPGRG